MPNKTLKDRIKSKQPKKKDKDDATMSVLDLLTNEGVPEPGEEEEEKKKKKKNPPIY